MQTSDYISISALFISAISIAVSFYFGNRDKVKLKTESKFFPAHPDYDRAHLKISVVNHGRRPTLLTMFGGNLEDGGWLGTNLGGKDKALRLGEHEFHEIKFYRDDIEAISPDSDSKYVELWFQDSLGNRHLVKNSKKGILSLAQS